MIVRPAAADDLPSIADLLLDLADFYDVSTRESAATKNAHAREYLFDDPSAHLLVACENGPVLGLAAYSFLWPAAGTTRSLYLKELYVHRAHRRSGVGRALMEAIFAIGREKHCSRVEWTADQNNPDAQRFYESLGAVPLTTKLFYRIENHA